VYREEPHAAKRPQIKKKVSFKEPSGQGATQKKAKKCQSQPWEQCHVDIVGPLTIQTPKQKYKLLALRCINLATGWLEVVQLPNKLAITVMNAFNNAWLTQYPCHQLFCFDNGNAFKATFKEICKNYYGLISKPTTMYNLHSNGII
jgi:hypothetical protein